MRKVLPLADLSSAIVAFALIAAPLVYLWTDLTYDEAVYLLLARRISEWGLPLRRVYEDFSRFRLFANSPPLVIYITSLSQILSPGNELLARLVQIAAFVLPTYFMVWRVARGSFGPWAATASLLVLLTNVSYMRATTYVLLNVPLGMFAFATLIAFYNATRTGERRQRWALLAAVGMALAVWTKYQSVCIAAAIAIAAAFAFATRGYAGIRSMLLPTSAAAIGGAIATAVLGGFFWTFGGPEVFSRTASFNADRMNPAAMSTLQTAREVLTTAGECVTALGGAVLLVAVFAVCTERRHRGLLVLLASYVAAMVAFNIIFFRLPGAGDVYLHAAVPALAVLAGVGAARLIELAPTIATRTLLVTTALAIQITAYPASLYELPRVNGSRIVSGYIAAHGAPNAGVLADTIAPEFYSGHPVRIVPFTRPIELVLRSLEGTSGDDISFVAVIRGASHRNLEAVRDRWNALLAEHFEPVETTAAPWKLYRRRAGDRPARIGGVDDLKGR